MTVTTNNLKKDKKANIVIFLLLPIISIVFLLVGINGLVNNFKNIYFILTLLGFIGSIVTCDYIPKNKRK